MVDCSADDSVGRSVVGSVGKTVDRWVDLRAVLMVDQKAGHLAERLAEMSVV